MELDKTFASAGDPVATIRMLCDAGLYDLLFEFPLTYDLAAPLSSGTSSAPFPFFPVPLNELQWTELAHASVQIMQAMLSFCERQKHPYQPDERRLLLLAAFLSPLWGYDWSLDKNELRRGLPFYILRHSLKLTVTTGDHVMELLTAAAEIIALSRLWIQQLTAAPEAMDCSQPLAAPASGPTVPAAGANHPTSDAEHPTLAASAASASTIKM